MKYLILLLATLCASSAVAEDLKHVCEVVKLSAATERPVKLETLTQPMTNLSTLINQESTNQKNLPFQVVSRAMLSNSGFGVQSVSVSIGNQLIAEARAEYPPKYLDVYFTFQNQQHRVLCSIISAVGKPTSK